MKAIVYYPKDDTGMEELARKVASVHANVIIDRIRTLDWSAKDKKRLFDAIIAAHQELAAAEQKTTNEEVL